MLLGMINYVRGNVRVEIRGAAIERFLNLCAQNQIAFWDVRRIEADLVQATVRIGGFRQLRQFARRMMCRVHIIEKNGMPFRTKRLAPRVALWGGALVCLALLTLATQMIWSIDLSGCDHTLQAEALRLVEEAGLRPGAWAGKIQSDEIKNYVLLHSDSFSFFAVNIQGSRAQVVAQGRRPSPALVPVNEPCDIVSDKTGVIVEMQVKAGMGAKRIGETVVAGDLLVAGTIVSTQQQSYQVHAMADVELRTWHTIETLMPTQLIAKTPTGRQRTRYALVLGDRRINLSFVETAPFACYDKTIEKMPLKLTDDTTLPAALIKEHYVEFAPRDFSASEGATRRVLEQRLSQQLAQNLPEAQLVESKFSLDYGQPFARAKLVAECREKAGILKEVSGNTATPEETND